MSRMVRYFLQGLLILFPVLATFYVLFLLFQKLNELVFKKIGTLVGDFQKAYGTS